MWVVEWLVRGTIAGSLGLSESFGKTSHTVSHSFSNSSMRGGVGVLCVVAEVTEVHVADIVVGVDFDGDDFRIFCSNFCGCGRFMKE